MTDTSTQVPMLGSPPDAELNAEREVGGATTEARLHIEGHILEGQTLDREGHEVRVTIIQGGKSKNGYSYSEPALQSIARLVEGAHAYADHARGPADTVTRSVRDVIGFYHDAQYLPADTTNPTGRVDATLHIFEAADWLWSMIQEACSLGRPELIGLSIDIFGQWQHNDATKSKDVTNIVSLNSCDVVTRPSAGGAFRRILHDEGPSENPPPTPRSSESERIIPTTKGDSSLMESVAIAPSPEPAAPPIPPAEVPQTPLEVRPPPVQPAPQQLVEQQAPPPAQSGSTTENVTGAARSEGQVLSQERERLREAYQLMESQRSQVEHMLAEAHLAKAGLLLERRLQESLLPSAVKATIRTRYSGRVFEESELETEITSALMMMAELTRDGLIRGHGYEKPAVGSVITEAEKIQAAFDKMFDLEIDSKFGNLRGFTSLHEAYVRVTGDSQVIGMMNAGGVGTIRVSEHAPIGRITEADTTTASFSYLLGTSMNKRLLKDYQAWPAEWAKFCTIVPVRDFKQQSRVRFGAFGSLPVVAEDTPYTTATLTDSAATYVPQKRGNLVTVSREVIINDDLQAVKQIPTKLAVAAAYTLAEFVYGFLSGNPNIYDGSALFTSGAPHSNLGASALSTSAMQSGVTAMREQTNYAGKRIGLRPRYLVVPPELEWTAMVVTKSAGVPGSNNNDINPMLGYVIPLVSPQLSSSTQWFLIADPREVDTIEVGFVGGQVNPALFIQDQPLKTAVKAA
jgi:hypothetical protein